jgi:hypothetical protein
MKFYSKTGSPIKQIKKLDRDNDKLVVISEVNQQEVINSYRIGCNYKEIIANSVGDPHEELMQRFGSRQGVYADYSEAATDLMANIELANDFYDSVEVVPLKEKEKEKEKENIKESENNEI